MKLIWAGRFVMFALGLAGAADAAVADSDGFVRGAGAAVFMSRDNENFSTQRIAIEYLPRYKHIESLTGVRLTAHRYRQNNWSRDGQQLTVLHRNIDPATANGWQVEAGLFRQGGYDLLTADGSYRTALAKHTGLELLINRDAVETVNALDNGVHFNFVGAGVEQELDPHITLVGLGARQEFSDGNNRNHVRLKLIAQPKLDLGLTLQARYRTYTSSGASLTYFNPSHYDETMLALGWRQRLRGWATSLTIGAGQQHVAGSPGTPTRLLEAAIQSPPSHHSTLRLRGGLNQSASFNGPDYRYSYMQGEWVVEF